MPISRLPDFGLEVYFSKWEFVARHHLCASDVETLSIGELLNLSGASARDEFSSLPLGYIPTWGGTRLREAIAATSLHCGPDDVLAFAGAEEAMFWSLLALLEPGDHAVVTVPNYQSMEELARASGADVTGLVLTPEDGWQLSLEALHAQLRPNTRVVAVNFPNNPTGALPSREVFAELCELCEGRGIRLFSDEVYRGLELDPSRTLPLAADLSKSAVSLGVMSKAYGLSGLRVGWVLCRDHALLERLERLKHYTSICNAGPSEYLATLALENREPILARNRGILSENLALFDAFFSTWGPLFEWRHPDAGAVAFPRYCGPESVDSFCEGLVRDTGVLFLPGTVYLSRCGTVPVNHFRVGLGRRNAGPALRAVDEYLSARNGG